MADEATRSQRALQDFRAQNPDIANDARASAAVERDLYDLQVEDMKGLGVDETKLPTSPREIADWHRWYRANGYAVKSVPDLLTTAIDRFNEWRKPAAVVTPAPPPIPDVRTPAVQDSDDRLARRANVPQQPTRTVAPRPDAQSQPPPQRDRSDIVREMIMNRGRPRGRVVA